MVFSKNSYEKEHIKNVCHKFSKEDCTNFYEKGTVDYDECKKDSKHFCRKDIRKWLRKKLKNHNKCPKILTNLCYENLECGHYTSDCSDTNLALKNEQDVRICADRIISKRCKKYLKKSGKLDERKKQFCKTLKKEYKDYKNCESKFSETNSIDEVSDTEFFKAINSGKNRRFKIILDKSGSMNIKEGSSTRWEKAKKAISAIVNSITKKKKKDIDLFIFSNKVLKYEVDSVKSVDRVLSRITPSHGTRLDLALNVAFTNHFENKKESTILVITDGLPDSESKVFDEIKRASDHIANESELSVTFIQIGNDKKATNFLKKLDEKVYGKFDIVDTISHKDVDFEKLIKKAIKN